MTMTITMTMTIEIVTALAEKVVFEESIKESDGHAIMTMLRRVRKTF